MSRKKRRYNGPAGRSRRYSWRYQMLGMPFRYFLMRRIGTCTNHSFGLIEAPLAELISKYLAESVNPSHIPMLAAPLGPLLGGWPGSLARSIFYIPCKIRKPKTSSNSDITRKRNRDSLF